MTGAGAAALLALAALRGPDRWFGADKLKHFVVSALAQSAAYSALQYAGAGHRAAVGGSLAAGAAVAIGREVYDKRTKHTFSYRDLTWDAAGLGGATLLVTHARR